MSKILVKMFPAKNGDCFLVSLGTNPQRHILIDCGYTETYQNFLKDELRKISSKNEVIDLMVITHVDQDHILGAIKFLEENNKKPFIQIKEIWHNSYRHLQFEKEKVEKIPFEEEEVLRREIALGKSYIDRVESTKVRNSDISAIQGSSLASLILEGGYLWNKSFGGKAVNYDTGEKIVNEDIIFHLLSPNTQKLKGLSNKWLRELKKNKLKFSISNEQIFDDAFEFFMIRQEQQKINEDDISRTVSSFNEIENLEDIIRNSIEYKDESITNGSSISFVIEYCGKYLLFLADSHPDIISDNIMKMDNIYFDLVKLSHHGSKKNTTSNLAESLNTNLFLISTNGEGRHSHPDLDSLVKIIYYQMKRPKKLLFNYQTVTSEIINNEKWKEIYNYSVQISDGSTPTIVEL